MRATTQLGPGDPQTWGATFHPNDPRAPEPADEEDPDAFADHLLDEAVRIKALCRAGNNAGIQLVLRDLKRSIEDLLS